MRNPVLREFHTERNVILEKRRFRVMPVRGGSSTRPTWPRLPGTPLRTAGVIGDELDILALSREDIADFLARYYAPSMLWWRWWVRWIPIPS